MKQFDTTLLFPMYSTHRRIPGGENYIRAADLESLSLADVNDILPIIDSSVSATKRMTVGQFRLSLGYQVSLSDYLPAGYVTDGSVDYTTEIQSALTAAAGKVLFIPAGTYLVSATLTVSSNTVICGAGVASIIKLDASKNVPVFTLSSVTGARISNFKINGNGANQSGGDYTHGIYVNTCTNINISGVEITGCYGAGILVAASSIVWIDGCYIHDTGYLAGSLSRGIYAYTGNDIYITNNEVTVVDGFGITVEDNARARIIGNYAYNVTVDGIQVHGSDRSSVLGNTVTLAGDTGIVLESCNYSVVSSNTVELSGVDGIVIAGSKYNSIVGNTIKDSSQGTTNTNCGISVTTDGQTGLVHSTYNSIVSNIIIDGASKKSQYSIEEGSEDDAPNTYLGNITIGGVSGNTSLTSTSIFGDLP